MYLYHFLSTLVLSLRLGSQGAAQTVINKDMIQTVTIPLPSILEQQKIVSRIGTLFDEVANLEEVCRKKIRALDELKQSFLRGAFAGHADGPLADLTEAAE
jgi:type I restriction enzyme S subunit